MKFVVTFGTHTIDVSIKDDQTVAALLENVNKIATKKRFGKVSSLRLDDTDLKATQIVGIVCRDGQRLVALDSEPPASATTSSVAATPTNSKRTRTKEKHVPAADELHVEVHIPALGVRKKMHVAAKMTAAELCVQLLSAHHQLDSTAKYGIAVSEQLTGLAPAVDPTQSFGALGVQSGAVLVCGVLEAEAKAAARDVLVVSVDGKLANTAWASSDWATRRSDPDATIFVTVEYQAAGVTKNLRWPVSDTIADTLAAFCEKVGVSPPTDYGFFYVPHGLSADYEVAMHRDEKVAVYQHNLIMSTVHFRQK